MANWRVKYRGSFKSVGGVSYRVEIMTSESVPEGAEEVQFAYETPVEIEWNEVDKLEPIQGSCLTLTLQSLKDRQFIDLYSIETGAIRADVYRDGKLYWSGQLDTELYEEPYSTERDYDVTFSFSDFAVLERKNWSKKGISTIQEVIEECVAAMGIYSYGVNKYISTARYNGGEGIDLSTLYVVNENFYDEDGEAMTMREVLEETLRPFGLRMVQKGGYLWLYDLNAVWNALETSEVWWKSDDSHLGVDVVYNNVKLTLSPYAESTVLDGALQHDEVLPERELGRLYLTENDWTGMVANAADGFRITTGSQEGLGLTLTNGAMFYRIDSDYSGSDEAGVVWSYRGNMPSNYDTLMLNNFSRAKNNGVCVAEPIITTERGFLGYVGYMDNYYQLKITLDLLFDTRYNPFESAGKRNEEKNWERLNDWCNFGYVPVMLYLKDSKGNILMHYENSGVIDTNSYKHENTKCKWVEGTGKWGCMWLCYYDWDNRKSATGFGGWQKNKPIIGYYRDGLPKKWKTMGEGELISLPPHKGGYLELQVGRGIYQFDYKREEKDIYSRARWLLYKNPTVKVVKKNGTDIDFEDIEDTAWINRAAKEELTIDTIIGTPDKRYSPTSRGLVMDSAYSAIKEFCRGGVYGRLEHLLIGTVYSQYASRHNTLTGTVAILPEMRLYTDASTEGKYILLSEVQDLMQDSSEITMAELTEENYQGVEYK